MLGRAFITACSAIALSSAVYANQNPLSLCPSASAIQNVGVSQVAGTLIGYLLGMEENRYSTDKDWVFFIGPFLVENENEAIKYANANLSGLSAPISASYIEDDVIECLYEITYSKDLKAVAYSGDSLDLFQYKMKGLINH